MRDRLETMARRAREALGGIDLLLLLSVLAVVGGVWVFAELADEVVEGETRRVDELVLRSLRSEGDMADPIGPVWFEEAERDLTALGGVAIIGLVTLAVVGFLLMCRSVHAAILVLVATLGGQGLSTLLKLFFDRPRPDIVPHLMHASQSSFPSGHSMLAAVTYLTLGALLARLTDRPALKLYILGVAMLITLLVGTSRVYLGVHYPTDVLAGWVAGLAWSILCWEVARALQRRGVVEKSVD